MEERGPTPISRFDLPEDPIFRLVGFTFDDSRARFDETASDLISIYDTLMGTRLGEKLPRPTRDPQRLLRGFRWELERVLYAAVEARILEFERYEVPWPFPEVETPEERAPEAPVDEKIEDITIKFFDILNRPIANAPYEVTGATFWLAWPSRSRCRSAQRSIHSARRPSGNQPS